MLVYHLVKLENYYLNSGVKMNLNKGAKAVNKEISAIVN